MTLSGSQHAVLRCHAPHEQTVVLLYYVALAVFLVTIGKRKLWWLSPFCYVVNLFYSPNAETVAEIKRKTVNRNLEKIVGHKFKP